MSAERDRQTSDPDDFRLALADAVRPLADASAVKREATRVLGRHLRADRVIYVEAFPDGQLWAEPGYADGVPDIAGRYHIDDWGAELRQRLPAGQNIVVHDVPSHPGYTDDEKARYRQVQIAANLSVPLLKDGRLVAVLGVHQSRPRTWTPDEVSLVEDAVLRTWDAVQRARAEAALRASEQRLEAALAVAQLGTFEWDVRTDRVTLDDRSREIFGFPPGEGSTAGEVFARIHPDDLGRVAAQAAGSKRNLTRLETEYRVVRPDGSVRTVVSISHAVPGPDGRAERMFGVFGDVTDRRRTQDELRYQLDLTRSITDNATTAIFMMDARSRCTFMNPAAEQMTGFTFEEVSGRILHDFIHHHHPDGRPYPMPECPIDRALPESFEVRNHEDVFIRKSGEFFPVVCNARVVYKEGRAVGTVIEVRDVTEERRAERRKGFLADLASATQPLSDPAQVAAVSARLLGQHLACDRCAYADVEPDNDRFTIRHDWVTAGWRSSTGTYSLDAFGPRAAADMRSGRTLVVRDVDGELAAGEGADTFNSIQIKAIVCCPLVKGGRLVAMMAVHQGRPRDWAPDEVTLVEEVVGRTWAHIERVRAELALKESEERFRQLAETIPQLAWMANPDGHVTWYNRRWYEYTGTTPEAMEGWGWQAVMDPDLLPGIVERWNHSVATGEPFDMVLPVKGGDGAFRPFLTRVNPLKDDAGRVTMWFGTNTDITEQKRAEEVLRESDRRKDQLISMLAHELRNPLAPIRNSVALLRHKQDAETVARVRDIVGRQSEHLARIVDDLLEVSRLTRGKASIRRERVDFGRVVRVTAADQAHAFHAAGLSLVVDVPDSPVWVTGDHTRLTQVVENLLGNARKFTERGRVEVALRPGGETATLTVRDTGVGITPELLPRIFEPFTQADETLERTGGGLGLGLSLVRGLVELHGGSVSAESAGPGRGATFTVTVPAAAVPPAVTEARPAGRPAAATRRLKVVIVEDNKDSADSLRMLLELCGCEVTVAYTGPDGVAAALAAGPDLVLCDIGLPGMNGYDVARRLNAELGDRKPVLVALTGYGEEDDKRRAREAGFDRHFTKPVDPAALEGLLVTTN